MKRLASPLALAAGLACALPVLAEAWIVKDGQPRAQIVLSDKPARMTRLAATELQTHIEKMTGAKIEIVTAPAPGMARLYVGRSAATDALILSTEGLAHGAFRMASGPDWLALLGPDKDFLPIEPWAHNRGDKDRVLKEWDAITGDTFADPHFRLYDYYNKTFDVWEYDERGAVNAVHEFLRGLGCRWYFPGELGAVVPKRADIALPAVDRTVRPDFDLRRYSFFYPNSGGDDFFLWRLRLGLNFGPDLLGLTQACHGSKFVTTRDEMKKAHPEYYALWAGKRATDHRECGAPCLSSEGFHAAHLKFARAMFDHFKEPMLSLDVCDGYGAALCGCDLCKGKGTPERGWRGAMSDYVWGYVDRTARELLKSNPDRKVSGLAYSAYMLPPEKIDRLSPNLSLIICQTRNTFHNRDTRDPYRALRADWLKKLPSRELIMWEYYLQNRPGHPTEGVPVYFHDLIAEDLRSLKGVSCGELIEVYNHADPAKFPWDAQAVNHLNLYVTSRLWWNVDLDLDALLEEYYTLLYGPARNEMKAFIEYSNKNWMRMTTQVEAIDRSLELLAAARRAAGDSPAGKRIDLVAAYVKPMTQLRERLSKGRENVPEQRAVEHSVKGFKLDGSLDDKFWESTRTGDLRELQTGRPPKYPTSFRIAWGDDGALYLGIRCTEPDLKGMIIGTTRNDDPTIWTGDVLEVLIETQVHSYYQIAISPSGAIVDLDRSADQRNTRWSSAAQVVTQVGDGFWTAEVRLPCAGETARDIDPNNGIAGRPPSNTYPWFINVCRQRTRGKGDVELSAWSPTGKPRFNEPLKFGKIYIK
jgi:hypothetical protein